MAKSANPGELRTPVTFKNVEWAIDAEGYPNVTETDVFGAPVMVKWVNTHGTESYTAMQMQLREPATLTLRYSPKINRRQIVYRVGDSEPYEIISVDDVEMRHAWLEIKVQRREAAR